MELRPRHCFAAVAAEQNVTRAAARLNGASPPLRRPIRGLDTGRGIARFSPGAISVRLTQAGRVFPAAAREEVGPP